MNARMLIEDIEAISSYYSIDTMSVLIRDLEYADKELCELLTMLFNIQHTLELICEDTPDSMQQLDSSPAVN